jgi:hypothetical protein
LDLGFTLQGKMKEEYHLRKILEIPRMMQKYHLQRKKDKSLRQLEETLCIFFPKIYLIENTKSHKLDLNMNYSGQIFQKKEELIFIQKLKDPEYNFEIYEMKIITNNLSEKSKKRIEDLLEENKENFTSVLFGKL